MYIYICMYVYIYYTYYIYICIYICRITRFIMKLKLGKNEINALPEYTHSELVFIENSHDFLFYK